jgi:crossover junction endodeoxyribonuclease RuvC
MIAHVIPAKRMPLSLPFFDYTVSEPDQSRIKIGQLVKIPFRNTEEFGIVYEIDAQTPIKTKPLKTISSIVFEQPLLHKQQLDFLTEISDFYHVSLGFLIKTNLPPLQKRKLEKLKSVIATHNITTTPVGTISKPQLCIYRTPTEKTDTLIKKITEHTDQTLILVPEMSAIKKITDILPPEIVERLSIITSELNPKELFAAWFAIWSGEKKIIIGTRAALFLPWQNLEHIILDDEGNPNYKSWDMAPRLHTRDAALFLAKNHRAHTTLLSHTPAVETLFFVKNAKTLAQVGHVRGVVLLAAGQFNANVFEYTPRQIKLALTGFGGAEKRQMQTMIKRIFRLDEMPQPDDAADAVAIALCHTQYAQSMGKSAVTV